MDKEIDKIMEEIKDWSLENLEVLALNLNQYIQEIREDANR